jgi:hypothetical protein
MKQGHLLASAALLLIGGGVVTWHLQTPTPPLTASPPAGERTSTADVSASPPQAAPAPAAPASFAEHSPEDIERVRDQNAAQTAALIENHRRQKPAGAPRNLGPRRVTIAVADASNRETEWEFQLDPGVRLPAAILDTSEHLSPTQLLAMDAITQRFLDDASPEAEAVGRNNPEISPASSASARPPATKTPPGSSAPSSGLAGTPRGTWDAAQDRANESYRAIFGQDASNAKSVESGKEALGVK